MTNTLHRRRATRTMMALGAVTLSAAVLSVSARSVSAMIVPPPKAATPRASGITFNYRVTSTSDDKRRREASNMYATVRMQDGNIRMDYVEGMTPLGKKDGYVIIQGDAQKFIVVNPKDKQAMIMTADGFGSGLGALMNNPMLKMTISNTSFRFKDMGAGEPMLGYKTRKVRTWYSSTMELKAMMMPDQKIVSNDSSDQWIAQIDIGQGSFEQWAKSFGSGVRSTNPELAEQLKAYNTEYGRKGMPLKTVTWSSQTDKKGKVTTDVMTMEVTDLKAGDIDAAMFEIPKGYEVVDLTKMMADAKASMDSANAEAAKNGKGEEKPSAKDALKKGLGGLIKKK
jgi:hypothetical protein